jgi:hypothetical protein
VQRYDETYVVRFSITPISFLTVAMRLAMSCGLNRIPPIGSDSSDEYLSSILQPPKNVSDTLYRMNTFWHAFTMDRGGSVCCDLEIGAMDKVGVPHSCPTAQALNSQLTSGHHHPLLATASHISITGLWRMLLPHFLGYDREPGVKYLRRRSPHYQGKNGCGTRQDSAV